jgi:hypothetical protein
MAIAHSYGKVPPTQGKLWQADEAWLLLVPGLSGVRRRPDLGCGGNDSAMLRIGKLQTQDIAAQLHPAPGRLDSDPVVAGIDRVKQSRLRASRPNVWSDRGHGAKHDGLWLSLNLVLGGGLGTR